MQEDTGKQLGVARISHSDPWIFSQSAGLGLRRAPRGRTALVRDLLQNCMVMSLTPAWPISFHRIVQ